MAHYSYLVFFVISHLLFISLAEEESKGNQTCPHSFQCGNLSQFTFPFTNQTHPDCGLMVVDKCNETVQRIRLGKDGTSYNIKNIAQDGSITLEDHVFYYHLKNLNCESLRNLTLPSSPFLSFRPISSNLSLFKCIHKLDRNITTFNCSFKGCSIYYNQPDDDFPSNNPPNCSLIQLPVNKTRVSHPLSSMLTSVFSLQVEVSLDCRKCRSRGGHCNADTNGKFQCLEARECEDCLRKGGHCQRDDGENFQCSNIRTGDGLNIKPKLAIALGAGIMGITITCAIICIFRRKKTSPILSTACCRKVTKSDQDLETFIRNYKGLAPKRYSYSNVKKMTNSFKDKLGQGGYGSVYKGKLSDGLIVAVKLLNRSEGNGQEFINEVASISRTSHVNVVTLLGFCLDGRKRALIYEFMPNGSLEKFVYNADTSKPGHQHLGWEKMYEIVIGIAKGLEYLHRGCNTRIVHFDIKPHNILLDKDFCPKISDFGLAKLCSKKESIVSMSDARGTVGYIAPEVFSRNFGEVSHKSDVYSYGMMILELVGCKNNLSTRVDHSSEIYFPHWIYKHLERDYEFKLSGVVTREENEITKKMIIVGLWCIQAWPSDRPPMSEVIKMLQGNTNALKVPPKPFASSPPRPPTDSRTISTS